MSEPEHQAWLNKADNDWLNIENNLAAARIPWDTIRATILKRLR